jgi:diketogulonate reductase-like aldo/keto reductase
VVSAVGRDLGRPAPQVAINWARQQHGTIIPVVTARSVEQAVESFDSVQFELTAEQMMRLSAAGEIEMGFPHDFVNGEPIRRAMYGRTDDWTVDRPK